MSFGSLFFYPILLLPLLYIAPHNLRRSTSSSYFSCASSPPSSLVSSRTKRGRVPISSRSTANRRPALSLIASLPSGSSPHPSPIQTLQLRLTCICIQIMPHSLPKHRPHLALHLHRNRKDDPGVLYQSRYRHVVRRAAYELCAQDLEY